MKKLTISDIAKLSGVAKSSVSMAINNHKNIPASTRNRILKIIKDNNYYPLESAQTLKKGKTDAIAFMTVRLSSDFTGKVLESIENKAISTGRYKHGIIQYATMDDIETRDEMFNKILYGRKASALIALAINPAREMIQKYKRNGIPVILLENRMKGAHSVNVDNFKGAFLATEYLIKSGRKKIGIISGGFDVKSIWRYNYSSERRMEGFKAALKKHGLKLQDENIEMIYNYSSKEGSEVFDRFVQKGVKVDAIFCASGDATAMGVMKRAKELKIRIPQKLAIIGFDNKEYSENLNPALTTVSQPIEKIGFAAFDLALNAIDGKIKKETHILFDPELIIRESA